MGIGILLLLCILILVLIKLFAKVENIKKIVNKLLYVFTLVFIVSIIYVIFIGIPFTCECGSVESFRLFEGVFFFFCVESYELILTDGILNIGGIAIFSVIGHFVYKFIKKRLGKGKNKKKQKRKCKFHF